MVYFKKALQLEISGENRNSLYIRLNIALTELNLGQLEKAKKGFTGALTLIRAKEDAYAEIRTLGNLGDIYVKQDSVELAISYLNKATDLAISNNQMMDLIRMHSSMSQAYEQKGDTKEALRLLKEAHSIESEMNQGISETLTEHEFRQEIQVYELENNKIKTQRDHEVRLKWMLLFALILTGSITCLLLVYILRSARQKRQLLKHELRDTKLPIPAENNQFKEIIDQLELLVIEQELFKQTGLTLDQIAKLIGTNRSYLSEAINTHYQKSFTQWLGSIRIQSAKEQLTNAKYGHLSIEGISKNAGFSSISTFNSHFKNETGLTPSYFRKNAVN
jgi:AraC-like DNA-binding protein